MDREILIDLSDAETEADIAFYYSESLRINIPEIPAGSYSELRVAELPGGAPILVERGRSQIKLREGDYSGSIAEGTEYVYMILIIGREPYVVRSGTFIARDIINQDPAVPANAYTYEGEPLVYDGDGTIYTYTAT